MKYLIIILVLSVFGCSKKEQQLSQIGTPPVPPIEVQNVFLHVGKEQVPNSLHLTGKISIFDNDATCQYVYSWEKTELKLEDKKCASDLKKDKK